MPRVTWSSIARQAFERQETDEAPLIFARISHPSFPTPICVVNDAGAVGGAPMTYLWRGEEWAAFPFDLEYLTDTDEFPTSRFTFQNVDLEIGERVRAVTSPMRLNIYVLHSSDFDLTVNPRVTIDTDATPDVQAEHLFLTDVTVDALNVSGTIRSWDYTQESWPAMRATQDRCPAVYR